MAEDRRAHERVVVRYRVQMKLGEGQLDGTVENLGVLGALVSTIELETRVAVGDSIALSIDVTGKGRVDASGKVLRIDQEFAGGEIRRTFAIKFDAAVNV